MSDEKQVQHLEMILQQLEALPTLPAVAMKLLRVTAGDEGDAAEVVRLIKSDPSLTSKVLAMCRGAEKGIRHEILTVDRAVVLLGFDAIRNAVLSIKVFETFGDSPEDLARRGKLGPAKGFDRPSFWRHSLAVAIAAELIAEQHPEHRDVDPAEAFVCGLLHDLGKLALDYVLPKSYERVVELAEQHRGNIADVERKVIGLDHHSVGKRLGEYWQLPHSLQDCMWLHGSAYETVPDLPHKRMIGLIGLADLLVRQQHIGYSGNFQLHEHLEARAQVIGLSPDRVARVVGEVHEELERRSAALGLGAAPSRELFLESIMQANALLATLNHKLERRTRLAVSHDKVLTGICTFHHDLSTAVQSVQGVMSTVVRSAGQMLGPGYYGILFQSSKSAPWLLIQYDTAGTVLRSEMVEPPPGAPWLSNVIKPGAMSMELMGILPWITDFLIDGPDIRKIRMLALPCSWGTAAVLLHDREITLAPGQLEAMIHTWGGAVAASVQHEGAKRIGERLAEANRDLTAAQDRLMRSQTLTRVGELAAGAAHEMNNPLAVISGRAQLLAGSLPPDSKDRAAADLIYHQSQKLSDLITSLKLFADPPKPQFRWESVESILIEAINMAKVREPDAPAVRVRQAEGVGKLWTDKRHAADALSALVLNALQAGGKQNVRVDVQVDPFKDRLRFEVSDTGVGMDAKTLAHAFDPFFSAKPAGRQVGLGLSRAQRLVEGLGGEITLESAPGQGTRASLSHPLSKPEDAPRTPSEAPHERRSEPAAHAGHAP